MKRNPFSMLLMTGLVCYASVTYAQENNYITSKYDFIPGEKVIFFDDFATESVGDFPAQWLTNGSGEIVTSEKFPGRWFNMTKMGYYIPEAKEDFTDNFTIEFDFVPMNSANSETMFGLSFYLLSGSLGEPGGGGEPGDAGFQIALDYDNLGWKNWSLAFEQRFNGSVAFPFKSNTKYHIAIWVQKQRVRFYANETKVLDVPRAIPAGSKPNIFRFDSRDEVTPLICNFRIAAGLPDMRNRLLKDGKIISYGIQFDVNSDKLKPESYSTLKEISDILKENPTIRIQVVGHTDSDGDEASNLDLSKRRAMSVKNELAGKFGVDAARLETDGKGESQPLADNNTSVNKAKNRRVEFILIKDKPSVSAPASPTSSQSIASSAGSSNLESGSFKDTRDGKAYKTVKIGSQTWMAENLFWKSGKGCVAYDKNETNAKIYGYLYNWDTALTVCPAGWHLPSMKEWSVLITFLGGDKVAGGKLKETGSVHWQGANAEANNLAGFSALPGGQYDGEKVFWKIREAGNLWTADEWIVTDPSLADSKGKLATNIAFRNDDGETSYLNSYIFTSTNDKKTHLSVRCVKD